MFYLFVIMLCWFFEVNSTPCIINKNWTLQCNLEELHVHWMCSLSVWNFDPDQTQSDGFAWLRMSLQLNTKTSSFVVTDTWCGQQKLNSWTLLDFLLWQFQRVPTLTLSKPSGLEAYITKMCIYSRLFILEIHVQKISRLKLNTEKWMSRKHVHLI